MNAGRLAKAPQQPGTGGTPPPGRRASSPEPTGHILEHVIDKRPTADRLLVAELTGEAQHRARWRPLSSEEEHAVVAALPELANGRADLLAEVAGVLEGFSEGELDEARAWQAADLCRAAGADPEAIPAWTEEGRRRREASRLPPFSGGVRLPARLDSAFMPAAARKNVVRYPTGLGFCGITAAALVGGTPG